MPQLSTDDDVYRARLVYLGPPGYTLPWQKSYAQYGVFMLLVPVFLLVRWLLTWHVPLLPMWEICGAWVTSELIFRYVDPDRPARKVVGMLLTDWRAAPEPTDDQVAPRFTARRVVFRDRIADTTAQRGRPH